MTKVGNQLVFVLLAILTACSPKSEPAVEYASVNCAVSPKGFYYSREDEFWMSKGIPIIAPPFNQITVEQSGGIAWNGKRISTDKLDEYLVTVSNMDPEPITALDFGRGTPCKSIRLARALMEKHLHCSRSRVCLQERYWNVSAMRGSSN